MKLDSKLLQNPITTAQYVDLLDKYAKEGMTSGPKVTDALIHYTMLNAHRTRRLMKTGQLTEEMEKWLLGTDKKQHWIILTETWCGDAANSIPFFIKMIEKQPLIHGHVFFRDEHPELMDLFLTNGGRSIPKIIVINDDFKVLADWGPRPTEAQEIYDNWRNDPKKGPYEEIQVDLQKWYNQDKGVSLQNEWLMKMQEI